MSENENITINASSISPKIKENETQIILQRHCRYDKEKGVLDLDSIQVQREIVKTFLKKIKKSFTDSEEKQTYFLFASSNTESKGDLKRCVETTNIAMDMISEFFTENKVSQNNIMNFNNPNYSNAPHESEHITEPKMFEDSSGYFEYLKEKHEGINLDFWIDFEGDLSKEKRLELGGEGPDEIVSRGLHFLNVLNRYANYFHRKVPDSRLIIWTGTHYDLISPLVKQKILFLEKEDYVGVEYCGGISFIINELNEIKASVNDVIYPVDFQDIKQPRERS